MDQGKSFKSSLVKGLCDLAHVYKLRTIPYCPETNGQCECFSQTLINMIDTLPTHAKKNWQAWVKWVSAYNSMISNVMGFSPYFLIYGCHPWLPVDIEFSVMHVDILGPTLENYAQKFKARLKWSCKATKEVNSKES